MRLSILSAVAKLLRIQFHFEGVPYGGPARLTAGEDSA